MEEGELLFCPLVSPTLSSVVLEQDTCANALVFVYVLTHTRTCRYARTHTCTDMHAHVHAYIPTSLLEQQI